VWVAPARRLLVVVSVVVSVVVFVVVLVLVLVVVFVVVVVVLVGRRPASTPLHVTGATPGP
jgi:hypothetical protein